MTIKEIKQDAKVRTTGRYVNLIVINILYSLLTVAFTFILSSMEEQLESSILNLIIIIALIIISLPLSYGVIVSTMKIIRNEDTSSTEFINIGLQNISKVWKLFFRTFLKLLVPFILIVISVVFVGFSLFSTFVAGVTSSTTLSLESSSSTLLISLVLYIAAIIYFCIKSLSYTLSYYILYDNSESNSLEILNESEKLMKGKKWKYVGLVLSFIGWYLLIYFITYIVAMFSITAGYIVSFILSAILTPYIVVSQVVFYEDAKDSTQSIETVEKPEKEV